MTEAYIGRLESCGQPVNACGVLLSIVAFYSGRTPFSFERTTADDDDNDDADDSLSLLFH